MGKALVFGESIVGTLRCSVWASCEQVPNRRSGRECGAIPGPHEYTPSQKAARPCRGRRGRRGERLGTGSDLGPMDAKAGERCELNPHSCASRVPFGLGLPSILGREFGRRKRMAGDTRLNSSCALGGSLLRGNPVRLARLSRAEARVLGAAWSVSAHVRASLRIDWTGTAKVRPSAQDRTRGKRPDCRFAGAWITASMRSSTVPDRSSNIARRSNGVVKGRVRWRSISNDVRIAQFADASSTSHCLDATAALLRTRQGGPTREDWNRLLMSRASLGAIRTLRIANAPV